ncbi:hypothetical protein ACJMK2_008744 [Sinanodonta woodiana]|uniref:Uncharacterized protein n=1 Tax=Sinanodonta woodiana TaxID=1069815 RepID=A0ABD3VQH8_SINWO
MERIRRKQLYIPSSELPTMELKKRRASINTAVKKNITIKRENSHKQHRKFLA